MLLETTAGILLISGLVIHKLHKNKITVVEVNIPTEISQLPAEPIIEVEADILAGTLNSSIFTTGGLIAELQSIPATEERLYLPQIIPVVEVKKPKTITISKLVESKLEALTRTLEEIKKKIEVKISSEPSAVSRVREPKPHTPHPNVSIKCIREHYLDNHVTVEVVKLDELGNLVPDYVRIFCIERPAGMDDDKFMNYILSRPEAKI